MLRKKSASIILVALLLSLTGCSQRAEDPASQSDTTRTPVAQPGSAATTPPKDLSFSIRNAGTEEPLNGVVFANGKFYATGRKNTLAVSTDAASWTVQQAVKGGASDWLNSLTYGNGTWVAVGGGARGGGTIITSADAVTWKGQPSVEELPYPGIFFSGGRFFLAGSSGVYTSTDGVNWLRSGNESFMALASGRGRLVGVGYRQTAISTDGSGWQATPLPKDAHLTGVAFSKGQFVAVGQDGLVMTSSDGEHWVRQDAGIKASMFGVATDGTRFVAVGDQGTILTSDNGTAWKAVVSGVSVKLVNVTFGAGHFVAVGDGGTVLVSD